MTAFGNISLYRDNPHNAGPPTAGDDSTLGYSPGSRWYDSNAKLLYMNVDATAGAAIWQSILASPLASSGTVAGANLSIIAPSAVSATGGGLILSGGPASGGNNNGGAVTIEGGAAAGSGTIGSVLLLGIPATDPSVAGALYGAAGAVSISGG